MSARDDRIECVMRPAVLDRLSPRENPALLHGLDRSAVPAEEHEVGFGGLRREEHVENVRAQLAQRGLRPDDLRVTRSLAALCAWGGYWGFRWMTRSKSDPESRRTPGETTAAEKQSSLPQQEEPRPQTP